MTATTASTSVGNTRLLKIAALLRTLPRKRFNYGEWVGEDWRGAPDLSCGTTACALGWATTIPSLRKAGLYLDQYGDPRLKGTRAANYTPPAFDAAMKLFGISLDDAEFLFEPQDTPSGDEEDASPKYVASKIERFVAKREV